MFSGGCFGSVGEYLWVSTLAITLLVNVMTRTGWTRYLTYLALKKTVGLRLALLFVPSLYSRLHDEIKIYVGYFRFANVIALVLARAIVYQDVAFSGPHSPAFTMSAALLLPCVLAHRSFLVLGV